MAKYCHCLRTSYSSKIDVSAMTHLCAEEDNINIKSALLKSWKMGLNDLSVEVK